MTAPNGVNSASAFVAGSALDPDRESVRDSTVDSVRDSPSDSVRTSALDSALDCTLDGGLDSALERASDSVLDSALDSAPEPALEPAFEPALDPTLDPGRRIGEMRIKSATASRKIALRRAAPSFHSFAPSIPLPAPPRRRNLVGESVRHSVVGRTGGGGSGGKMCVASRGEPLDDERGGTTRRDTSCFRGDAVGVRSSMGLAGAPVGTRTDGRGSGRRVAAAKLRRVGVASGSSSRRGCDAGDAAAGFSPRGSGGAGEVGDGRRSVTAAAVCTASVDAFDDDDATVGAVLSAALSFGELSREISEDDVSEASEESAP